MDVFINNVKVTSDIEQKSISITLKPDGERSASLTFYDVLPTVQEGDELEIFQSGNKLFGGIITSFSVKYFSQLTAQFPVISVSISSSGYNYIANRRIVNVSYNNTNVKNIVQDMRDVLSDESIVAGTITSGPVIDYSNPYVSVKQVLDDMANAAGYVWYIDNSRRLQFVKPQSVVSAPYALVENGTFKDFHDLSWSASLDNYANKVYVLGTGTLVTVQENTAEIARKALEADGQGTGIYGAVVKDSNLLTTPQLDEVAAEYLRSSAVSQAKLSFSSYTAGWQPGTKLRVQIRQITGIDPTPPNAVNNFYYLIEEVKIDKEEGGIIKYGISATRRYDSDFTTKRSKGFEDYFKEMSKFWN